MMCAGIAPVSSAISASHTFVPLVRTKSYTGAEHPTPLIRKKSPDVAQYPGKMNGKNKGRRGIAPALPF